MRGPEIRHFYVLQSLSQNKFLMNGHPQQLIQSFLLVLSTTKLTLKMLIKIRKVFEIIISGKRSIRKGPPV